MYMNHPIIPHRIIRTGERDLRTRSMRRKKALLDQYGIAVWRDHDHTHAHNPDGIFTGVIKYLGWEQYRVNADTEGMTMYFEFPDMTVEKMNALMNAMNTSSGLKLSLRWKSKTAEKEEQLDTNELVGLLKRDAHLLNPEDFEKLSKHFRSKVEQARRNANDSAGVSFYQVMKDTLDYRKWFEFQLFSQKNNERRKELTNSVFGTFSGGEKAMSMYVHCFRQLSQNIRVVVQMHRD